MTTAGPQTGSGARLREMRIVAAIVTHNRLEALRETLARTLAEAPDRVVVVDNASTDGTGEWLAAHRDPRLEVLTLARNAGGAGGFAAGLEHVFGAGDPPDWCALFDDDARPLPGAFAAFRAAAPDPAGDVGAIAAAVFHPDGAISEMNRPGLNPFWHPRAFLRAAMGGRRGFHVSDAELGPRAPRREIDVASFVGYFVSRGAVARAGLPEAGLFLYGDDVLYSLRLRRAGLRIELWPALRFEHACGTMAEGYVYRPVWKIYYHCRNGVQIAREAAGPLVFPAALAWYVLVWWRRSRHCPTAERPTYRRLMWRGIRDGLAGRRGREDSVHGAS